MAELRTPGVYVQQVDSLSRPLQALGTRVAAFVGKCPDLKKDVGTAKPVNDWLQFRREYFPDNAAPTTLAYAVHGFFANGGGRCYISNLGPDGTVAGDARKGGGVAAFDTYDEISMVAAPGYCDPASYRALIDHAERHGDRLAILDCVPTVDNVAELTEVAMAEPPKKPDADGGRAKQPKSKAKGAPESSYAATYFPHIVCAPAFGEKENVVVPPSGCIAGVYAQNDAKRGVHNAPANYSIRTAIGLTQRLTHDQQGLLNEEGVNVIRHFRDDGIKIWGARTRSGDPQWRYVNVRRLYMMISESIQEGMQWAVFCPNNTNTQNTVAFNCRAFLKRLWMDGALVGNTPEEAYFVECSALNNPPETVDAGILKVQIGIAPVKPAEFIVIELGLAAGRPTETQS